MKEVLPFLIGGLALFLFAIFQLSEALQEIFTDRARRVMAKYTSNLFSALLIGLTLTVLLDSSSAVIILVIVFINAKTLNFRQAIGIIMGANIGTTISSQIIALQIGKYSVIPLLLGLLINIIDRKDRYKGWGDALFYFGMLFFGLFVIEHSVLPLRDSELFLEWIRQIEDQYVLGALIGGLITLIIQSSSGTVGMAIILGNQDLLTAAGGIALMLGAELGTCSDTLIATIRGRMQAIKAGVFHLVFNLSTILVGLLLFGPFVQLVVLVSGGQEVGTQIANAHVLFNVLGVLFFLPLVGLVERALNRLLPDKIPKPG